ncbi:hypothetical protein Tco_0244394, partial [Tanacetum coccineum]
TDPKSFTKIFTIKKRHASIRGVLGFRKTGEPLIEKKKDIDEDELFVYESNSQQFRFTGIAGGLSSFFVRPYMQILLLLDH